MDNDSPPLTLDLLEGRLEEILEAALSSRRTIVPIVQVMTHRTEQQQHTLLHWLPIVARVNPELAFQCAQRIPPQMDQLEEADLERWVGGVLDRYDQEGLQQALTVLRNGPPRLNQRAETAFLADIAGLLTTFVAALGGRPLTLAEGEYPHTNTETLFLPPSLAVANRVEDNHTLYRCLAAHLWSLGRFGTYFPGLPERLGHYPDPEAAAQLYLTLESCRMDAILGRLLPGLGRFMLPWQASRQRGGPWQEVAAALAVPTANRENSLTWTKSLYGMALPTPLPFHGARSYRPAMATLLHRLEREKQLFRRVVNQAMPPLQPITLPDAGDERELELRPLADGMTFELLLDGQPLLPPDLIHALSHSIIQDLGQIPPEYLTAAGAGGYAAREPIETGEQEDSCLPTRAEVGTFLYDEWDFRRNDYRKGWCVLKELPILPSDAPLVATTLAKYRALWQGIRRSFELLRGRDLWLRRQLQGDEVDTDTLVQALTDSRAGLEMDERLFRCRRRNERDVATLILVDMSGSTKGWVIEAIQESLVLFCKALQVLGDRYAVYGFSSRTRKQCELFPIKRFEQPYGPAVEGGIAGIAPMEYTRMGVFIRHATAVLNGQEARTRLLITLSDGKPEDYDGFYDGYRGQYAIEDTRKALIEARRSGIHPFCITVDTEAREYLPRLYGPARYVMLDDVRQLPVKIADIYRRLTTG
ncbi:MAG: nitric oxide reductase activation protein [Magnetococcales bacterium]|nr:nitric oxide reductase activation protein [Magnetococcales bacterium]